MGGARRRAMPPTSGWRLLGVHSRKLGYLSFGSYPESEHWRVDVTEVIGAVLIVWLLWRASRVMTSAALGFFLIYPVRSAYFFSVARRRWGCRMSTLSIWGGVFVTLITAVVGIVVSLPLGVLLRSGGARNCPW